MIEFGFNPEKLIAIPEFIFSNGQLDYESDRYIVYFGRLVREKGILTLVEAMRNLPLVKLLVIGDGSYRKDLENLVLKQGINNVEFKGYISTDNMKMILKNAMFAVIPSEWYEVFGLVILESFAMGKPVIGANIGAIPELINDGLDGLLFRPGDIRDLTEKITYLFNNKEAIVKMGKSARSKVLKDYNADIHYDRISQVYQNLI
jgi:glycosyltransferase involved in cell wall biosynthesis